MFPRQQQTRVGFVGIIIDDRKKSSEQVNKILSDFGSLIVSRTGMPYPQKKCCVITLIVDAQNDQIGALAGRLGQIEGISVKSALSKER